MHSDNQLLAAYAEDGSEHAFGELVDRHIDLVYSAALRESRNRTPLAEDTTQAVFVELARRARELKSHPTLAGWLYTCVRQVAANLRRAEDRRQRREQQAVFMNEVSTPTPTDELWQEVHPILDDAMHELKEEDRAAVVLRYFEGRTLREVGAALGVTENAARMRVERALSKLHMFLSRRGIKSAESGLAAALAIGAVTNAPAALAAKISTTAMAAAATGSMNGLTAKHAHLLAKVAKLAVVGAAVVAISSLALWYQGQQTPLQQTRPGPELPSFTSNLERMPGLAETSSSVPGNPAAPSTMALRLLDAESGQPLPDARLHLFYMLEDGRGQVVKGTADANGRHAVPIPQPPYRALNLFVTADGHVPMVTSWGFRRDMPPAYTMKLERGVRIAGRVLDEEGLPISGAQVEFNVSARQMALADNIQFGPDTHVISGVDGHWACAMIPRQMEKVLLRFTHADYAEMNATIRPGEPDAQDYIVTMKTGFQVAGAVLDTQGNAIEGAEIREVRGDSEQTGRFDRTDPLGVFELRSMPAGQVSLSIQADGFAPALQTLQVTGNVATLRFELGPGQLLRGRVVDDASQPVPNAWVEITRGQDPIKWSSTTDVDGRFSWNSAPKETLPFSILAEGFRRVYALPLQADGSEHEIKLQRKGPDTDEIKITGTAMDAETGQPLDDFKVMVGDLDPEFAGLLQFGANGTGGEFSLILPKNSSYPSYQLQLEKDGYIAAVTAPLSRTSGNQTLTFKLQRGAGPSGVVLLPGGAPAVKATVLLCTARAGVMLDGPAQIARRPDATPYRTETDQNGQFRLPAVVDPQGVIVVHSEGYAELPALMRRESLNVILQPWGRIEGSVILEGHPAAGERVLAYKQVIRYDDAGRRFTFVGFEFSTTTDASGSFTIDKVPPGPCSVVRQPLAFQTGFEAHQAWTAARAGEITEVVLGGTGRTVVGKALFSGADRAIDWQGVIVQLRRKIDSPLGPRPRRTDFASRDDYVAAAEQFFAAADAQQRYGAFCSSDGSFRLPDVPAGTYELEIRLRNGQGSPFRPPLGSDAHPELGSLVREVVIAESVEGEAAEPLNLGELPLSPPHVAAAE